MKHLITEIIYLYKGYVLYLLWFMLSGSCSSVFGLSLRLCETLFSVIFQDQMVYIGFIWNYHRNQ